MSLLHISRQRKPFYFNIYITTISELRFCVMQSFVAFSAFAGMTIPYPKREFLNDDDSDSKSSAAKVMEWYFFYSRPTLTICKKGECNLTNDMQERGM